MFVQYGYDAGKLGTIYWRLVAISGCVGACHATYCRDLVFLSKKDDNKRPFEEEDGESKITERGK